MPGSRSSLELPIGRENPKNGPFRTLGKRFARRRHALASLEMSLSSATGFSAATRTWFEAAFAAPTPAQEQAWPAIANGGHVLLSAPTGSGKTLAAFLWALDRLGAEQDTAIDHRTRLVYVSPLKALSYDIERN